MAEELQGRGKKSAENVNSTVQRLIDEAGADTVQSLFRKAPGKIGICVLSITELKGRLLNWPNISE